jgi:hypothetical protein
MSCFHCEHDRPADEFSNSQIEAKQSALQKRLERPPRKSDVSSAWNFDFDDNESDGADVATFEFADSSKAMESSFVDSMPYSDATKASKHEQSKMVETMNKVSKRESLSSSRIGFNDFDDEDDIDSYELDLSKGSQTGEVTRMSYSDLEAASDSEGFDEFDNSRNSRYAATEDITVSTDEDELEDHPSLRSSHLADSWHKTRGQRGSNKSRKTSFGSESDDRIDSDLDEGIGKSQPSKGNQARYRALAYSDDKPFHDDVVPNIVDRFQSRRTKSSTKASGLHGRTHLNGRRSIEDQHGRTTRNERFNRYAMHHGGPVLDSTHRVRGNQPGNDSRGLQRNVRKSWDRSGSLGSRR